MLSADLIKERRVGRRSDDILSMIVHGKEDSSQAWWKSETYYPGYAAIASIVKPSSILEVGVKLGYSLISMFKGYPHVESIVGIDNESYVAGSVSKAIQNIRSSGFSKSLEIHNSSSHGFVEKLRGRRFSLVHIDGDHTFHGAFQDICEYWDAVLDAGIMIVDDSNFPDVGKAVSDARVRLLGMARSFHYSCDTGWEVIVKK